MEVESSTYTDFISCDRAGRRNAVHDIQRDATTISMRKLTEDLGDLAVEGAGELPRTPVNPAPGTQAGKARHKTAVQPTSDVSGSITQMLGRNIPFLTAVGDFMLGGYSASWETPQAEWLLQAMGWSWGSRHMSPACSSHGPLLGEFVEALVLKQDTGRPTAFPGQATHQLDFRLYKNQV